MYKEIKRPQKEVLVRAFFSQVKRAAKTYVCLPSTTCRDVEIALEMGAINKKTKIFAVEQDPTLIDNIHKKLTSLGVNFELTNLRIEQTYINKVIDLAYIDLCGQISADILCWFHTLNIHDDAHIAFTFSKPTRSHHTFYERVLKYNFAVPKLVGPHCESDPIYRNICGSLTWSIPNIKWNIAKTYRDSKTPMYFLGGYFNMNTGVKFKTPKVSQDKVVDRLKWFAKNEVERPQQVGGFKIMWNALPASKKSVLRKTFSKTLKKIGV